MCFWSGKLITVYLAKVNFSLGKENTSNQLFLYLLLSVSVTCWSFACQMFGREKGWITNQTSASYSRLTAQRSLRAVSAHVQVLFLYMWVCMFFCKCVHECVPAACASVSVWPETPGGVSNALAFGSLSCEATSEPVSKWLINNVIWANAVW